MQETKIEKNNTADTAYAASAVNPGGIGYIQVAGIPDGHRLLNGQSMELTVTNASGLTVTSACTWEYDKTVFDMKIGSGKAQFKAKKPSAGTTIRVSAGSSTQAGMTYPFTMRVDSMQIYLSPANHYKEYMTSVSGNTTERENMEAIASYLKEFLSKYCVDVKISDIHDSSQQYYGRPKDAEKWFKDKSKAFYFALHSDAISSDENARGSTGYYNSLSDKSFAEKLASAVDAILPNGTNRSESAKPGDTYPGETSETKSRGIPAILLENGFHSNKAQATFLVQNEKLLASTIGNVLVGYFDLTKS